MADDAAIIRRLRASRIPPYAYFSTIASARQTRLELLLRTKAFAKTVNGHESFIITPNTKRNGAPSVAKVCALLAKDLVLLKERVVYTPLAELFVLARHYLQSHVTDWVDGVNAGDGFLVVGEVGESITQWPRHEWDVVQSMMFRHYYLGGGLILGDAGAIGLGVFNSDFTNAFDLFTTVQVE